MLGTTRNSRLLHLLAALALVIGSLALPGALAHDQDDAGTGTDAGDSFETATPIERDERYAGDLDPTEGDSDDWYKFPVEAGGSATISLTADAKTVAPIELVNPNGIVVDSAAKAEGWNASATGSYGEKRVSVLHAPLGGDYRLHVSAPAGQVFGYGVCIAPCDEPKDAPIELLEPLDSTDVRVLLIPPAHGDLGDTDGPTREDYRDAALRGIRAWEPAIDDFTDDHPRFSYLDEIDIHVDVYDGVEHDRAGYDVIVTYAETSGYVFRGVATVYCNGFGLLGAPASAGALAVHKCNRVILLSQLAAATRAGQVVPDYPEVADLESVTKHEFAHGLGLGHTEKWTEEHGPDLMNSPSATTYGNGHPLGDGGERSPNECITSLDLYGLSQLYRDHGPHGESRSWTNVTLPADVDYELYCVAVEGGFAS